MRGIRLFWCLVWAYDVSGGVSGPEWIRSEKYDIVAKAPGPVPEAQLKLMLQRLLEERFKLKLHRETKELPTAVLIVAKNGPKNLKAIEDANSPKNGDPYRYTLSSRLPEGEMEHIDGKLVLKKVPMSSVVIALGNRPPYGVSENIVDQTAQGSV